MFDSKARGGVRRYLDNVKPEEYKPSFGEVDLSELSLTGLADLFGSDKGKIKHEYCQIYEKILDDLIPAGSRKTAELNIVEYGVACGASLRMWANYLPKSNIFGIDIRDDCKTICSDVDNVSISILDVTKKSAASFLGDKGAFDLIIDDGLHYQLSNLNTLLFAMNNLKIGGFFIIEDIGIWTIDTWKIVSRVLPKNFDSHIIEMTDTNFVFLLHKKFS